MFIFTAKGRRKLSLANQHKFESIVNRCFRFINWDSALFQIMAFLVLMSNCLLLSNAWRIDQRLCLFWLFLATTGNISCVYGKFLFKFVVILNVTIFIFISIVLVVIQLLLILFAYYIILWQRDILYRFGAVKSRRVYPRCQRFEALVDAYVNLSHLLTQSNNFWSFYLSMYLNLFPMLIVYFSYLSSKTNLVTLVGFMGFIICYVLQLLFLLFICSCVTGNNQTINKRMDGLYRTQLEPDLKGALRLHVHLDNMLQNVRSSKCAFRTIDKRIIDRRTYIVVLFKFLLVYIKILCNNNFK